MGNSETEHKSNNRKNSILRNARNSFLNRVVYPGFNYLTLPAIGFGAGAYYGHQIEGAIGGAVLRLSPWLIKKGIIERIYSVGADDFSIEFDGYKLLRNKTSESQMGLTGFENIKDPVEYYNSNKSHFAKNARIVGPNQEKWWNPFSKFYFKKGTHQINVKTVQRDIDPDPQKVTSFFHEMPIDYYVNFSLLYKDLPIPFALAYVGALTDFKKTSKKLFLSEKQKQDFYKYFRKTRIEKPLVDSAKNIITGHYSKKSIREAIQTPIDSTRIRRKMDEIKKDVGVDPKFEILDYDIPDRSQEFMLEIMKLNYFSAGQTKSAQSFADDIVLLNNIKTKEGLKISLEDLIKEYNNHTRNSYLNAENLLRTHAYNSQEDAQPDFHSSLNREEVVE